MHIYIYIYICQIEKKKDNTEVIKTGSRDSGWARVPCSVGRAPTQIEKKKDDTEVIEQDHTVKLLALRSLH